MNNLNEKEDSEIICENQKNINHLEDLQIILIKENHPNALILELLQGQE